MIQSIKALFFTICLLVSGAIFAQNPVRWSYSVVPLSGNEYQLVFTAELEDGWNTYSQFLESQDGPVPTSFTFAPGAHFKLIGQAEETGEKFTAYDEIFAMNLTKIKHKGIFTQKVQISDTTQPIKGTVTYMVCNHEMCLPPKDKEFEFRIPAAGQKAGH